MNQEDKDFLFNRFKNNLEECVKNSYHRISSSNKSCYCPLGVVGNGSRRPTGAEARLRSKWIKETPNGCPSAFTDGFDGAANYWNNLDDPQRYYELGQQYAKMFP